MDNRTALERFWYGTPAEHRVRRAVTLLCREARWVRGGDTAPKEVAMDATLLDGVVELARKVTGNVNAQVRVRRVSATEHVAEVLDQGLPLNELWHLGATAEEALTKLKAVLQAKP